MVRVLARAKRGMGVLGLKLSSPRRRGGGSGLHHPSRVGLGTRLTTRKLKGP